MNPVDEPRRPVLVADDEPDMLDGLTELLEETGRYRVLPARDGTTALELARTQQPDLLVLDIQMPGMNGIEVFRRCREEGLAIPAIIVTGHGDIQDAFEAFRYGIAAFIAKHRFDPGEFLEEVDRLVQLRDVLRRDQTTREQKAGRLDRMVGQSSAMEKLRELIRRVAPTRAPVLITGPSGTGKELVAAMIHNLSPRAAGPFVPVNCAAIPETLIESTLFGHVKGSFTGADRDRKGSFEEANGGSLFLDEIGDMSLASQAKILRALQEQLIEPVGSGRPRRVDVRVVAATNKTLPEEIAAGRFREDLYYRINVVRLELPPLSDRREDIPALVEHFAGEFAADLGEPARPFEPEALSALASLPWPGNIRELRNAVERLLIMARGSRIRAGDVQELLPPGGVRTRGSRLDWPEELESLEEFQNWAEARFVLTRLRELYAGWSQGPFSVARASESLGISKSQVYKILDRAKQRGWVPDRDLRDLLVGP